MRHYTYRHPCETENDVEIARNNAKTLQKFGIILHQNQSIPQGENPDVHRCEKNVKKFSMEYIVLELSEILCYWYLKCVVI